MVSKLMILLINCIWAKFGVTGVIFAKIRVDIELCADPKLLKIKVWAHHKLPLFETKLQYQTASKSDAERTSTRRLKFGGFDPIYFTPELSVLSRVQFQDGWPVGSPRAAPFFYRFFLRLFFLEDFSSAFVYSLTDGSKADGFGLVYFT